MKSILLTFKYRWHPSLVGKCIQLIIRFRIFENQRWADTRFRCLSVSELFGNVRIRTRVRSPQNLVSQSMSETDSCSCLSISVENEEVYNTKCTLDQLFVSSEKIHFKPSNQNESSSWFFTHVDFSLEMRFWGDIYSKYFLG